MSLAQPDSRERPAAKIHPATHKQPKFMCYGCFEAHGKPQIVSFDVILAAHIAQRIDGFGPCHIVVEDFNVEDSNVEFCLKEAKAANSSEDISFCELMLLLSEDERASALALAEGWWAANPHT